MSNRHELKCKKIDVFKTYMLITTNSSEQKSKDTFKVRRFPILYLTVYRLLFTVYSYLYYFCCLTPFLWTTYCTSDSYITAFSYFSRIQNNISRTRSVTCLLQKRK